MKAQRSLTWPKFFNHPAIACCAELVHFMTQFVAVYPNCTESLQLLGDGALPTAAASRQADDIRKGREMWCVLAHRRQEKQGCRTYNKHSSAETWEHGWRWEKKRNNLYICPDEETKSLEPARANHSPSQSKQSVMFSCLGLSDSYYLKSVWHLPLQRTLTESVIWQDNLNPIQCSPKVSVLYIYKIIRKFSNKICPPVSKK